MEVVSDEMILHVITNFSARSGAEAMLCRLLRLAPPARVMVAPLMSVTDEMRRFAENPDVIYAPQGARSPLGFPGAVLGLSRLIRREKPEAVVCWMYHAMAAGVLAARLAGNKVPVIWNVRQSLDDPASLTRSTRLAVRMTRALSGVPDGIIFNADRARDLHAAYGFRNDNVVVIPNGFDLPTLEAEPPRRATVFGIAGRFHPQKDYETFFRAAAIAAAQAPEIRFAAAGRGVEWSNPAVAELVAQAGLPADRITLQGGVEDMAGFYRSIDALVLSSRTEGFPNVIAEAMSHARPAITTDVGDSASIVGRTGMVVPPRDPQALAASILAMHALDPASYADLSGAARLRVEENYSLQKVARRYDDFIASCRDRTVSAAVQPISKKDGAPR